MRKEVEGERSLPSFPIRLLFPFRFSVVNGEKETKEEIMAEGKGQGKETSSLPHFLAALITGNRK